MLARNQERSPLYCQGYQQGQSDAEGMLAQVAQAKGVPLTKQEIHSLCSEYLQSRTDGWKREVNGWPIIDDRESGWCAGFTWTCILAERQAPGSDGFHKSALPNRQDCPTLELVPERSLSHA